MSPDRDAQSPIHESHNPLAHVQNGPQSAADILGLPDAGKGSNMMVAAPLRLHDDTCAGGACKPGSNVSCDDGNPCTDAACDMAQGCTHTGNSAPCTDGNVCTLGDTCASAACVPGTAKKCDDGNLCTDDSCDPQKGCQVANNTAPCSDGSVCTVGDTCAAGTCKAGVSITCNDGNVCTDDSCDASKGCVFGNNTANCNDNNGCTGSDTCSGGKCAGTTGCDAHALCTAGPSSVACKCSAGWAGDGFSCADIDECKAGTATCPAHTVCNNSLGSYDCSCDTGYAECDGNTANGCESNLATDAKNCGSCNVACSNNNITTPTCSGGTCNGTCNTGFGDCNSDKKTDGCELNVQSDASNCGGCGKKCSNNNLTTPTCAAGSCNGTCNTNYGDCNSDKLVDGCEQSLQSDPNNCGACGNVCPTVNGSQLTCNSGYCAGGYAVAKLSSGNKQLAFVYVPAGTVIASNTDYANYCTARGFSANMNAASTYSGDAAGMYSTSAYYCNSYCCYLGAGNGAWGQASGFQNYGLPTGVSLRVFDRGCGNYCGGTYQSGLQTNDAIYINSATSVTYQTNQYGSQNYCDTGKSMTMNINGVVVCQMK